MHEFHVTDGALNNIRKSILSKGYDTSSTCLRLGVTGSGCNGFKYYIGFETNTRESDVVYQFDDVRVVIDKKSLIYLSGTTLDWHETMMAKGYKFNNPNVKTFCGCKKSFNL